MEEKLGIHNCVLAFCHFCEHHGPCVVFHTRLAADSESNPATKNLSVHVSTNSCMVRKLKFKETLSNNLCALLICRHATLLEMTIQGTQA